MAFSRAKRATRVAPRGAWGFIPQRDSGDKRRFIERPVGGGGGVAHPHAPVAHPPIPGT